VVILCIFPGSYGSTASARPHCYGDMLGLTGRPRRNVTTEDATADTAPSALVHEPVAAPRPLAAGNETRATVPGVGAVMIAVAVFPGDHVAITVHEV